MKRIHDHMSGTQGGTISVKRHPKTKDAPGQVAVERELLDGKERRKSFRCTSARGFFHPDPGV